MNLRIVSWNVRGLNEQDKLLQVRNLIRKWKANIVCLQETKMELINRGVICSLWGGQHVDWLYLGSVGASGGVLLMWDNRVVDKLEEAPFRVSDIQTIRFSCSSLQFPSERSGSANFTTAMHRFSAFISEHSLVDLPLVGGNFTWSNSREVASRSRLDRFLLSADWEEKFPSVCQCRLSRLLSDHFPIILEGGNLYRGRKPFRLENMWLKDEGFLERLYSETEVHKPLLDEVVFSRISEEDASWLDSLFDEDEVFGVLHDFNGYKAPGPDGFTMTFFSLVGAW
ncbi:uncharacterized protein LOC142643129 [Castanea sativa]|uniref:uncharacterized protein LOC142643129 n=1 Tax=Castanea sativa TaxID=21020 RepID=UPI003F64C202